MAPLAHKQLAKMDRQCAALSDSATAMLHQTDCPSRYSNIAMRVAVYLRNKLLTPTAFGGPGSGAPYTLLHGTPHDISYLNVLDCSAYLIRPEDHYKDKSSPKVLVMHAYWKV
jgi:hypothetical protein